MASSQLTLSLDFLTDAAHLLRGAAPETSAHLMRHRAQVASHAGVAQHELQQQHVCSACGRIMLPGRGACVRLETRRARRKGAAQPAQRPPPARAKILTCDRCRRRTEIKLAAPEPAVGRREGATAMAKQTDSRTTAKPTESRKTANASSKQRAKNRKSGLQALLSRQQQSPASLTLADFVGK